MTLTPIDVRQQKFRTAFRGFNRGEVSSFLQALAEHYELAVKETQRLRDEMVRLETTVKEQRAHEASIKSALVAAQQLSADIKANAGQEAERIVRDAHNRADLLLEKTQARLDDIRRDINVLTLKRRDVEITLETAVHTLEHALEHVRAQAGPDADQFFQFEGGQVEEGAAALAAAAK